MRNQIPTYQKIQVSFKAFRKRMRDIWESYNLINYYFPLIQEKIKQDDFDTLLLPNLLVSTSAIKRYSKSDTYGAIAHLIQKANPRRTLIDAVSIFENFLGHLVFLVYTDFPGRLLSGYGNNLSMAQEVKLLQVIVKSSDRDEILSKIIEEKVRGIFYGKPTDFFTKDPAKLEFNNHFSENCSAELVKYQEITARRNVIVHNDGKVDRKYHREVKNPEFQLGRTVTLTSDYLCDSIAILEGLAAEAATLVLVNIYKQTPVGPLKRSLKSFRLHTQKHE